MKKILLLSLVAIGISATAATARAGGFSVGITIDRPCPPIFVPALPICAPPLVVYGGYEHQYIVRDRDYRDRDYGRGFHRDYRRDERVEHRRVENRREDRFHHDRF